MNYLLLLCALVLLAGCGRNEPGAGGSDLKQEGVSDRQSGPGMSNPVPLSASDPQPRFNQTGQNLSTQVLTNGGSAKTNAAPAGGGADAALRDRVLVALSTGSTGTTGVVAEGALADTIEVAVTNGVVTLRGTVGNREEIERLAGQVQAMEGVRSVNNELRTGVPSTRREGDFPVPKFNR